MGMYNEVFAPCPICNSSSGLAQVRQYVLGFGNFYLNDPDSLNCLNENDLKELAEDLRGNKYEGTSPVRFTCQNNECRAWFTLEESNRGACKGDYRRELIRKLFDF